MPKPEPKEDKSHFISRCVEQLVSEEGKTQDQALGMCYGIWEQHKKSIDEQFLEWLKKHK